MSNSATQLIFQDGVELLKTENFVAICGYKEGQAGTEAGQRIFIIPLNDEADRILKFSRTGDPDVGQVIMYEGLPYLAERLNFRGQSGKRTFEDYIKTRLTAKLQERERDVVASRERRKPDNR